MKRLSKLKLYNIKLSAFYKKTTIAPQPGVYHLNNNVCLTIYKTSKKNFINVTGVKSFLQLPHIKTQIERKFNLTVHRMKIDNLFLARKGFLNFDIGKLIFTCEKLFKPTHFVLFDILLFRGIFVVPREKKKNPSFIVFRQDQGYIYIYI